MWLEPEIKVHAPEIGRAWLNSPPLSLRDLRGRVVLVDFWDYTCVNCIRTLPYIKEWHQRYRGKGLTIIGVHAPEFSFARRADQVDRAIKEFGLEYPIVLDNEFQIWQSFSNRCWPAKYLIDKDGYIRYYHFGEGGYSETEGAIQRLVLEIDPQTVLPVPMPPVRDSDSPGARCYRVTPELYLGFERGHLGNESGYARNEVKDYKAANCASDCVYLDGPWYAEREAVEACPIDGRSSKLLLHYTAAEVNLVMASPEAGEAVVTVQQDGRPIAPEDTGEDVRCLGDKATVTVREPRMYRLVKNRRFGSRLLELSTFTPGLSAYAFTFVSCIEAGGDS